MNYDSLALKFFKDYEGLLKEISLDIWNHPEIGLKEFYSSRLLKLQLEREGFIINSNIAKMPTSFVATWGEGKPIIGILGEYDALPGLSQQVSCKRKPVVKGGPGHGCGHNLLGSASLIATLTLKRLMQKENIRGTIVFFGTPAEEDLIGKVKMVKEGAFNNLDSIITWHPMDVNTIWLSSTNALNSFKLNFYGKAAHAAQNPESGRSALDGIILTDIGVNYLREHITDKARIHCVITKGGDIPNIVPDFAQIHYYIRAPYRNQVNYIFSRIKDIAKGASLMTGTKYDIDFITGCYNYLPNKVLGNIVSEQMKKIGSISFNKKEKEFAINLISTFDPLIIEENILKYKLSKKKIGFPLSERIFNRIGTFSKNDVISASTDVGDVSYIAPTIQFTTSCLPLGIPVHTWQSTASMGSSIGLKGEIFACKVIILTVAQLLTNPMIIKKAHEEFILNTNNEKCVSPLQY